MLSSSEGDGMADLNALTQAITAGNRNGATQQVSEALAAGLRPQAILDAMVAGMDEIGRRFQCGDAFVPEMLLASRAMKESLALLEPSLIQAGVKPVLTAVIGTVEGDLHDIGKKLVVMMWKGANFSVFDLGTNVAPQAFVAAVKEHQAQVVGLSALLTTTMPAMRNTVEQIRSSGLNGVKVLIGGAPVTQQFADEIGADGFAPDAAGAVQLVRKLVAV
jgi:5-methyltetrahydrofolate--homocysteine methyltransferase